MGWITLPGAGIAQDGYWMRTTFGSTAQTVDATGEKTAITGPVHWTDHGTHDIQSVSFRTGTIVATSNSTIVLSLQDVSLTSGPPNQPDEVQDQTVSFSIGTISTSSTWYTKNLGSNRTVAEGENVAVVWEFDGSGRLGSDSLAINSSNTHFHSGNLGIANKLAGSWQAGTGFPNIIFTASDGTLGTIAGSFPFSSSSTSAYNSGSAADEFAIGIQYPFKVKLSGVWLSVALAPSADFEVVLYDGTTALATVAVDYNSYRGASTNFGCAYMFSSLQELQADTLYRIAVKPTTTNSVTLSFFIVDAVEHLDFHQGQNFHLWTRVNAGAWGGEVTTRAYPIVPIIKQVFSTISLSSSELVPGGISMLGVGR